MYLGGTFTGTFESYWQMNVDDEVYNQYLLDHPDFDMSDVEQAEEMWDYFKALGYYDEPMDSVDLDTTMVGVEIV